MAAYAEGLNILRTPTSGATHRRRRDHAAARPRALPVRPRTCPTGRRGVAARQRRRVVAARPHRAALQESTRARRSSAAACPTRARAAGRSRPRSTRAYPRRCSRRRCTSASARAARPTSRTSCSRRCASSSAGTTAFMRSSKRSCPNVRRRTHGWARLVRAAPARRGRGYGFRAADPGRRALPPMR
jgi:hypothetical protein